LLDYEAEEDVAKAGAGAGEAEAGKDTKWVWCRVM
jgi:hypothetical protein